MKREKLPVYFNLPIDASLANFSKNYNDIICINTSTSISNYNIFQKTEAFDTPNPITDIVNNSFEIPSIEILDPTSNTETVNLFDKYQGVISAKSFTKGDATSDDTSKNIEEKLSGDTSFISSTTVEEKSIENKSKNIIEANDDVRKTYELYEKMFNEGTFGKSAVPDAPLVAVDSTPIDLPTFTDNLDAKQTFEMYEKMFAEGTFDDTAKTESTVKPTEETTNEKSEARATFEMYEKMFAEGAFDDTAKTESTVKPTEDTTNEKSEARATFEMYEKMFAEGTFDDTAKTESTVKPTEEPTNEKSEARATFEMYEKMFAEGTFEDTAKTELTVKPTEETTNEKSEARATFEMYEKMFAEGTFEDTAKTELTVKPTEEPTNEKSEARATFEMYEKMFAEGTFDDTTKTDNQIHDVPKVQNIFEAIPNPLDTLKHEVENNTFEDKSITDDEKEKARQTYELYEKKFNEGSFESNENFKPIEFSKDLLNEDISKESNQSIEAFEKINIFFTNAASSTPTSDKVSQSEPNLSHDPNDIFSVYNLDDKEDNHSFFLNFDYEHGILNEWIQEHGDNIFKLKKITTDTYHFEMIENDVNHHFFVKKSHLVLDFCEILNTRHGSHSRIKTIRTGKILKENGKWVIKDKAKTMYQ